jgi:hypothetical protein
MDFGRDFHKMIKNLKIKPWKIFAISIFVEFFACLLCLFAGAAGHGSYLPAKFLFPYTMISTSVYGSITRPFILLGLIQFPMYGIILALAYYKKEEKPVGFILLVIHAFAVIGSLLFASDYYL